MKYLLPLLIAALLPLANAAPRNFLFILVDDLGCRGQIASCSTIADVPQIAFNGGV